MLGLAARRLCIYASDITYFANYDCISPDASFPNFQAAKMLELNFPIYSRNQLFHVKDGFYCHLCYVILSTLSVTCN